MAAAVGPWLGRLPLEVRELIYQQVLVEKIGHRMKSAEVIYRPHSVHSIYADTINPQYDQYRDEILNGLDHTWRYNTAILRTNSTLYREAMTVFKRDNFLVCLQLRQWNVAGWELRSCGFQPFATYDKAEDVPAGVAMTLAFGPHPAAAGHAGAEEWESQNYVFDSEDLHAVCTSLLRAGARTRGGFGGGVLGITIDAAMGVGIREMRDGFPHPQSKLRGLLEPLRRLHGFDGVSVDGPGSVVYKDEIVASLMGGADAKETMRLALLAMSRGDEACGAGHLGLAIERYKAGLELSRGNFPDVVAKSDLADGDSEEGGVTQRYVEFSWCCLLQLTPSPQCNRRHQRPIADPPSIHISPVGKNTNGPNLRRARLRPPPRLRHPAQQAEVPSPDRRRQGTPLRQGSCRSGTHQLHAWQGGRGVGGVAECGRA